MSRTQVMVTHPHKEVWWCYVWEKVRFKASNILPPVEACTLRGHGRRRPNSHSGGLLWMGSWPSFYQWKPPAHSAWGRGGMRVCVCGALQGPSASAHCCHMEFDLNMSQDHMIMIALETCAVYLILLGNIFSCVILYCTIFFITVTESVDDFIIGSFI